MPPPVFLILSATNIQPILLTFSPFIKVHDGNVFILKVRLFPSPVMHSITVQRSYSAPVVLTSILLDPVCANVGFLGVSNNKCVCSTLSVCDKIFTFSENKKYDFVSKMLNIQINEYMIFCLCHSNSTNFTNKLKSNSEYFTGTGMNLPKSLLHPNPINITSVTTSLQCKIFMFHFMRIEGEECLVVIPDNILLLNVFCIWVMAWYEVGAITASFIFLRRKCSFVYL